MALLAITHKKNNNHTKLLIMIDFCGAIAITLQTIVKVFETDMWWFLAYEQKLEAK